MSADREPTPAERAGVIIGLAVISWAVLAGVVVASVQIARWLW